MNEFVNNRWIRMLFVVNNRGDGNNNQIIRLYKMSHLLISQTYYYLLVFVFKMLLHLVLSKTLPVLRVVQLLYMNLVA